MVKLDRWQFALNPRRVLIAGLTLCMLVSVLFGIQALQSSARLTHTRDVQRQAEHLLRLIVDAESSERGYVITGNPAYLRPFDRSRASVLDIFNRIRATVADNPGQVLRLDEVYPLITAKFDHLATVGALRAAGDTAEAINTVSAGRGEMLMNQIRAAFDDFMITEDQMLDRREISYGWQRDLAFLAFLITLSALTALLVLEIRAAANSRKQLILDKSELENLVQQRTRDLERERLRVQALLADVNHRVGNSLGMATALLNAQARQSKSAQVKEALADSIARIRAIAAGQRRLQLDVSSDTVAARPYFENYISETHEMVRGRDVTIAANIEDLTLSGKQAVSYILLANEFVTNALKHAFPHGESGCITLVLHAAKAQGGPVNCLIIEDDGIGLPAAAHAGGPGAGVGSVVTAMLLKSLGGNMETRAARASAGRPGTRVVLTIPCDSAAQPAAA